MATGHRSADARLNVRNITLAPELMDQIFAHCKDVYPLEACGLLVGQQTNATRFLPTPNRLGSAVEYEIDPALLAVTFRTLRQTGEQLIGIVHSHPKGPAEPSETDLRRAYYPEAAHVIVSLATLEHPQIRAFRIIDEQSYEIEVHAIL